MVLLARPGDHDVIHWAVGALLETDHRWRDVVAETTNRAAKQRLGQQTPVSVFQDYAAATVA